jgi:hypothetical protein
LADHHWKEGDPLSTYTTYALAGIKNREVLLAAIATLGVQAQVYDQAHQLHGYYNYDNKQRAEVVIPKSEFTRIGSHSYVDVGFAKGTDGSYSILTDGHLPTMVKVGDKMVKVEDAVQAAYKKVAGDAAIKTVLTRTIPRLKQLGKIPSNATVRKQTVNGQTRVLVSY